MAPAGEDLRSTQAQAQAAGQASSSGQLPGANNQAQAEAQALHYTSFPQAQVQVQAQAQAQPEYLEICDEYERGFAWFAASSSWGQPREEDEYSDEER